MAESVELDVPAAHSLLELDLAEALERIEAILNKQPGAFVNEDETTRQIRKIINGALKKAVTTAGFRRLTWPRRRS
jgi:hypothetical protein